MFVSDFILGKTVYTVAATISMNQRHRELENHQENTMFLTLGLICKLNITIK